ncbi:hypothetical protein FHS85_004154 [Rhodoligotrophos appendicifer]|uniref:amidohydrolase family protein n=1 Tax=Rhodoligotrophos appendicifer TaxID=987056 RepID=UPI0011849EAD|nr:amidohydrolase family protein [Rhodoligotrophos appendicifer]
MAVDLSGSIDCDVHPAAPDMKQLLPYLDEFWRDMMVSRGTDGLDLRSYPPNSPLSVRPDWRIEGGKAGSSIERLRTDVLDRFHVDHAILNCLYGAPALYNADLGAVLSRAANDWLAKEWLDRDPRLRASIILPTHNPLFAAEEIERRASDRRFVQALMFVQEQMPLGRRHYWPIYEAAEKHGLPIGIHAGSLYRNPTTSLGWPSYVVEEYVGQATAFQHQLLNLLVEGVFTKFPDLKIVLIESGFTWLPHFMWRATKTWIALRTEIPWVDRSPSEIIRENVRLTIQPTDAPPEPGQLARICDQLGSDDMLLFSTDYPHWHFEGDEVLSEGIPERLHQKIIRDNAVATYPRLKELVV